MSKKINGLWLLIIIMYTTSLYGQKPDIQASINAVFEYGGKYCNRVLNERLDIHWIDRNGNSFWYPQRQSDGSVRLIKVNPESKNQEIVMEEPENSFRKKTKNRSLYRYEESDEIKPDKNAAVNTYTLFIRKWNVWMQNNSDKSERQLTFDGNENDGYIDWFIWTPDGNKLLVFRVQPEQKHTVYMVESSPEGQKQPKLFKHQYLKPGDKVQQKSPVLFDFSCSENPFDPIPIDKSLFADQWSLDFNHISADSSEFRLLFNQRGHQVLRLIGINSQTGSVRTIIEENSPTFIDYSGKFFFNYSSATEEGIWMSERNGWNHLFLYDMKSGQVKNTITSGKWNVRSVEFVDWIDRKIWLKVCGVDAQQDPYYFHLASCNLDGKDFKLLTEDNGTDWIEWSPDGQFFINSWSAVDTFPRHELRNRNGELILELCRADGTALTATDWKFPEKFSAPGSDGKTPIYGVIYRPANFDKSKKYPVLEYVYAGPQDFFTQKKFDVNTLCQEMAQAGFIVVQSDGRGTSWRNRSFHDACYKNLAKAGFPDRIAWIKAAAEHEPAMDITRVGIFGSSAGGQTAAGALIWYNDFYKAAVADCGCHDNCMDKIWWNEQWMGYPIDKSYDENSNTVNARLLKGRLFILVGEMDTNVDTASSMQLADALVKAGTDFDMFVLPGSGHGTIQHPVVKRKVIRFFQQNL